MTRSERLQASTFRYWLGEGCQNSFVVFDLLETPENFSEEFLRKAHQILLEEQKDDALILLPERIRERRLWLQVVVLEPDKSIAAFCGNGSRVVAAYLQKFYMPQYTDFSLVAHDGEHRLFFFEDGVYGVDMLSTKTNPHKSSFVTDEARQRFKGILDDFWYMPMSFEGREYLVYFTETSEPHLVVFEDISSQELTALGTSINSDRRDLFPKGISINRVKLLDEAMIDVMTYERGVNRITRACGTGSTSSAVLCRLLNKIQKDAISVQTAGGFLLIEYDPHQNRSIMKGPAYVWSSALP